MNLTRHYNPKALKPKKWCEDPALEFEGGKKSVFDMLEDTRGFLKG